MLACYMAGHSIQELNTFASWINTTLDTVAVTAMAAFLGRNLRLRSPQIQRALCTNTPSHLRHAVLRLMTDRDVKEWPTLVQTWNRLCAIRKGKVLSESEVTEVRSLYLTLAALGGESASTKRLVTAHMQTNVEAIIGRPGSCAAHRGHQSGVRCKERGQFIIGLMTTLVEDGPLDQSRLFRALYSSAAILATNDFWGDHPTYGQCLSIVEKSLCNRTNSSRTLCGGTNPVTPRE